MYWVKCKQTQIQQLYVHIFFCLTVIRPWPNLPNDGNGHESDHRQMVICMGNLEGVVTQENTPEGRKESHKRSLFPYKQVSRRNGDHEWLRMTNVFILCDLIWKVQKCQAVNKEGSFEMFTTHWSIWDVFKQQVLTYPFVMFTPINAHVSLLPHTRVKAGYHSSIYRIFTSVWWCTNVAIV